MSLTKLNVAMAASVIPVRNNINTNQGRGNSHCALKNKRNMLPLNKLTDEIKKHNELYRKGEPIISDVEYDALVDKLKVLDPLNDWFKQSEPGVASNTRKSKLPIPMKSLNKAKNIADVLAWIKFLALNENETIIVAPKFDGLSLLYSYKLDKAFSRGGAENEGQDCTPHYHTLKSAKNTTYKLWDCVFGEFVFNCNNWKKHFEGKKSPETGDKYKSPRNTAAGMLNRDEASELIQYVDFYRYGIDSYSLSNYDTYKSLLIDLCEEFNQPGLFVEIKVKDLSEKVLKEYFKSFSEEYYIDGLVLYINDINIWERIGRHQSTGNPLYAIAYKHPDFTDSFYTTVKDVIWKVSKSGALKPVVNMETVDTGDCSMENPTGYNASWISDNQIAKGAQILVTRSGGVIPKILATIDPASKESQEAMWDNLSECPHCGAPTRWNESGVELCCTNALCNGIQLAKMVFFYTTCGAEGVGEETLSKIYNAGYTTIPQLLNISFDNLMSIDGFGECISNTILDNNKKIKAGVDILTLMHASDCFAGIGKIKAQKILEDMDSKTLEDFYNLSYIPKTLSHQAYGNLSKTQQAFEDGVDDFYQFVLSTGIPIIKLAKQIVDKDGKYKGMNVCFSGVRDSKLEAAIIEQGGTIASGVTKKTTHLVVKDPNASSSKITKAHSLGIPVIAIADFE